MLTKSCSLGPVFHYWLVVEAYQLVEVGGGVWGHMSWGRDGINDKMSPTGHHKNIKQRYLDNGPRYKLCASGSSII